MIYCCQLQRYSRKADCLILEDGRIVYEYYASRSLSCSPCDPRATVRLST